MCLVMNSPSSLASSQPAASTTHAPPIHVAPAFRCPHCGSAHLVDPDPSRIFRDGEDRYSLLQCLDCEGMFTAPLPSPERLERLYGAEYNYKWFADHLPAKLLDALHRVVQYRRSGFLQGKRILDFGGGYGYFSRAARLLGYDAITRDPFLEKVQGGSGELGDEPPYETVVTHHVLEHATDPGAVVEQLKTFTAPGGRLIVAVPNAEALGYKLRGVNWAWSQPPLIHIHHFTQKGLTALLTQHGFEVEKVLFFERWDASTLADVKLVKLFMKLEALRYQSPLPWLNAQLNSLLRFAAFAGTYVWPNVQGAERTELLVLARRPG